MIALLIDVFFPSFFATTEATDDSEGEATRVSYFGGYCI